MNYIKKLEIENALMREQLAKIRQTLCNLDEYFGLPKFSHPQDESMRHLVNTTDVMTRLRDVWFDTIPHSVQ